MKLYNLYHEVIFEQIKSAMNLFEAMHSDDVDDILAGDRLRQGKFYKVDITYRSPNGEVSKRFIEIYQRNVSTAGNEMIDAYQLSKNNQPKGPKLNSKGQIMKDELGNTKIESYEGWRKFRLDRIESFNVTGVAYYQPHNGFNPVGNNSPTVSKTDKIADIPSFVYKNPTQKNIQTKQKWDTIRGYDRQNQQPATQQTKQPEPQPTQQVQPKPLPKQNNKIELPPEEEDLTKNL